MSFMKKTNNRSARISLEEQRQPFPMEGTPDAGSGGFEILCITAGVGNGWEFSADVLRAAVSLFDGVQCFIDHLPLESIDGHSVRDVAGLISDPVFDEETQGIKAHLTPFGPSAELLKETCQEVLAQEGTDTKIGFSADLGFNCEGSVVTEIVKIYSVDLVVDPARGGAVLRALYNIREQREAARMRGSMKTKSAGEESDGLAALKKETADAHKLRVEMCRQLLENTLANSGLPVPMRDRIRAQFSGIAFDPEALNQAVDDGKLLYAQLTASQCVSGVKGRFTGMYSGEDQLTAAIHDLLGAERPQGLRGVNCAKLSGIRELYCMMTGDVNFHGGYYADRARFATTADLPGILKNALNKLIAQRWDELGASGYRWWENIVTVEHFDSLQDVTGILVGELNLLPQVNEGAAYQQLSVTDSPEVGSWNKYGAFIPLTIEMFERDDTKRLRQYPFKLATAGLRRISALVASVFTDNAGMGPQMADAKTVFHADHKNLGSASLSAAAWEAASAAIWSQDMLVAADAAAPKLAVDARYLIVPRSLRLTAQRILYPSLVYEANYTSENLQRGQFGDVITCPEFTDANSWAAVADPSVAPAIYIGERFGLMPEIYIADNQTTGALFTNDEIRVKARHFLNVMVADHRPLYKSNVTE
ncbi:MAG: hypothetical protein II969_16175 [Anaerolineaceae bacterium]|nr:hypothetical protein [Anaerolineaceae bacterium]